MVYHLYSLIFVLSLLPTVDYLCIGNAQALSLSSARLSFYLRIVTRGQSITAETKLTDMSSRTSS
jgi:hypothetical protein